MRPLKIVLVLTLPSLVSCGWLERECEEAAEAARQETLAEVERVLSEAVRWTNRTAGSADRILSPMPVMTPAEEARLRRYLTASHVASARRNGVRAWDRETVDSLIQTGRLVALEDSTVDLSYAAFAPPYETPDMLPPGSPDALRPHVDRLVDLALESVSARKSRELGRIFSDVLAKRRTKGSRW